jgi:hypothetical protein
VQRARVRSAASSLSKRKSRSASWCPRAATRPSHPAIVQYIRQLTEGGTLSFDGLKLLTTISFGQEASQSSPGGDRIAYLLHILWDI